MEINDNTFSFLNKTRSTSANETNDGDLATEDFLALMTTQLRNQDPLKPLESGDFLGQIAAFSTVSGIGELNNSFEGFAQSMQSDQALRGSALVGRSVLVPSSLGNLEVDGSIKGQINVPGGVSDLKVQIYNEAGVPIRTIAIGPASGYTSFSWDGVDDDGQTLPAGVPENIERVQSVIQQIKGIVTTEVSAKIDDKGDKTQLISNLVKQLLAKLPAQESVSKQAATVDAVDKVAAGHVQSATLRSDILQALTSKASAVTTNNNDLVAKATTVIINNDTSIAKMTSITVNKDPLLTITNSILKGEISSVNADEKHIDKISQLVDLLRPAKSDEQLGRTAILEKAAPAVSSPLIATTPLVSTSSITKTDGPSLDIQPSLQSKAWNNVLSSRVIWMAREGIQQAALKLNPANLGPVEVRLNMHNEQANITFIAHNAATRDALEQALPKLRESFLENGIELTDAEVSDPSSQQTQDDGEQGGDNIDSGESNATVIDNTNENNDAAATLKDDADLGLSVYA
jgi:flagellar basal-body rod modification protein FlgD